VVVVKELLEHVTLFLNSKMENSDGSCD
jgi:hypothetical protein